MTAELTYELVQSLGAGQSMVSVSGAVRTMSLPPSGGARFSWASLPLFPLPFGLDAIGVSDRSKEV